MNRLLSICVAAVLALPAVARAQSASATPREMETILFVQAQHTKDGQDGIRLIWIPQPLQKFCLGKTADQCSAMDFCIRTTTPSVKMCQSLAVPLSRLPSYPPDMVPRRQMSVTFFRLTPDYFANLQDFYRHAPKASLEHLSLSARVKARVRFIRKPDDDDFDVLQILAVAPF